MKAQILGIVSAIAILAAVPALAETQTTARAEVQSQGTSDQGTGNIVTDAKKAWKDIKNDTHDAYKSLQATMMDESNDTVGKPLTVDMRHTGSGMIGASIYNAEGSRVGTLKDVIVDSTGAAMMVVVADNDFPGFDGKLAAFDYSLLARMNKDGDIIAPLTEDTIEKAAEFSYDLDQSNNSKVRTVPAGGYSVAEMLDGKIVDPAGNVLADIDNLVFRNGHITEVVAGFDKTLGMGGKDAAFAYTAASVSRNDDGINLQLSANQAEKFKAYKNTATN